MLPALIRPYAHASTAIATLPAHPPFTPAETGYVWTGSQARSCSGATGTRSTTRRSVPMRRSSATIATASSCSRGRTSRNQPMPPATDSTKPRAVTDTFVSRPANASVHPDASTSGHAVGAGTSSARRSRGLEARRSMVSGTDMISSARDDVHDGEHDDPDGVDEVPVEREDVDARRVDQPDPTDHAERQHDREHHEADGDVERMQADERVVGRAEEIRGDRQAVFVDQSVPFLCRAEHEQRAQGYGQRPQRDERASAPALER